VIGDPMNNVHMSKNKSFISSNSIKLILNQLCPLLWCVEVLETALLRGQTL